MSDVIATTSGVIKTTAPMNGKYYTLLELQSHVGGNIEVIMLQESKILIVDEEGKLKGKLPNHIATGWITAAGYHAWVAGDALLTTIDKIR